MSRKQLDQLIERASAFADDAIKHTGEVAPIWHMVTAKGETIIELTPPGDRDCALMILRTLMELMDVVRYVHISEGWMRGRDKPISDEEMEKIKRHGVRNDPKRIEVVLIAAEDYEAGYVMTTREIIRPKKGKPYLGPLVEFPQGHSEGRMIGMLPMRGTVQ
jgi:hypothetical protein